MEVGRKAHRCGGVRCLVVGRAPPRVNIERAAELAY